jgi:flagellar basal-body rod modification protein FlgD
MADITNVTGSQAANQQAAGASTKAAVMGKDDFLKLLVAQLQHQDPMNPMDDKEFMGQMAQFSTLEQITNVGSQIQNLASSSDMSRGVALLGHGVTYTTDDDTIASGTAKALQVKDGQVFVSVDGTLVDPSTITEVTP